MLPRTSRAQAVDNINNIIAKALVGKSARKQGEIDKMMVEELDGTENEWGWCKQKLGANAILAVSIAVCKAGAAAEGKSLFRYIADIAGAPPHPRGALRAHIPRPGHADPQATPL